MLQHWLISGAAVAAIALTLGIGVQWAARPESYHDAVREALDQRHIAYTGLEVREICLPDPSCVIRDGTRTFAAVMIHSGTASTGQISCYDRRGDCYLDLLELGIRRAPLNDLRGVRMLPKPLARVWEFGAVWLRGWLKPTPGL
jgi:hypothetical protein